MQKYFGFIEHFHFVNNDLSFASGNIYLLFINNILRPLRCCENCQRNCCGEFKQVINLKNSGLLVYMHEDELKHKIWNDNRRSIILYNSGDRELKRFDYIVELCRYKTKCLRCTALVQRVRSLLDDITTIRKDEIFGICDYCKQVNKRNKCKKCQYIVDKFIKNKVQECQHRDERFMTWFAKVQRMLLSILQSQVICKHNVSLDSESKIHLDNLIRSLKPPLPVTQPTIEVHPDMVYRESNIIGNKQILDELITKLKSDINIDIDKEESFIDLLSETGSTCICKYLKMDKTNYIPSSISDPISKEELLPRVLTMDSHEDKSYKFASPYKKTSLPDIEKKEKLITKTKNKTEGIIDKKENLRPNKNKFLKENKPTRDKNNKRNLSDEVMLKMIKEREKEKKLKNKLIKPDKVKKIPIIASLPIIKTKKAELESEDSDSVVECNHRLKNHVTKMIKGDVIVPYEVHNTNNSFVKTPLLFKIQADSSVPTMNHKESFSDLSETIQVKQRKSKSNSSYPHNSGIVLYQLSNREFIEKGWTKLPTTKVMRRMNVYKMIPSCYEFDWFKNHKDQKILFYDTGEILAEVFENGCGKWFYRNGDIALNYYYAKDAMSRKRYIIYSSSEDSIVLNKKKPITVLACFDYLGNGVVYDHFGNVRLKYNQSEGMVIDDKVGPPGRWKWHTLNDPPVLQQVFVNTQVKEDPCLNKYIKSSEDIKQPNEDMVAIELENFLKEKAHKMLQKFRPIEIRTKVLKINNNFSLRIINQSSIYLMFRCGRISLKQNVGMLLKSDEIVDSNLIELADVSTPYDYLLSKSDSVKDIQNIVLKAKKFI